MGSPLSFSRSLSLSHTHTTHIYTVFDLFSRCLSLIIYFILSHLLAFTLSHSHSLSFSLVHILSLVFLSLSFIVSYHFISLLRASLLLIPFLFLTRFKFLSLNEIILWRGISNVIKSRTNNQCYRLKFPIITLHRG